MASPGVSTAASPLTSTWPFAFAGGFPGMRVLAWGADVLYASQGYTLLGAKIAQPPFEWKIAGYFRPAWWRSLTVSTRLSSRLVRDGFHALAVLDSGHLVAAVPGAIIALAPGETEFRVSYPITRGTRPLHIASTPDRRLFWGEYFDNAERNEVHVYVSEDRGLTWEVAYTFARGAIRHVHNIVYDEWERCLWVLTGDNGRECQILRASCDFRQVDVVTSGNQQVRAVALVPTEHAVYFSSDTPFESNHIHRMDRSGTIAEVAALPSSSIYGCRVADALFFSTMAEPSPKNCMTRVSLYGSPDGANWCWSQEWQKDRWPMGLFQYGNAFLPDGTNATGLLAVTTVAVENDDLRTTIWRITPVAG